MIYARCWCTSSDFQIYARFSVNITKLGSPRITIVKCNSCGTIRMHDNGHEGLPEYEGSYEYQTLSGRHQRSIALIDQFHAPGTLLDIGCNTGVLLSGVRKNVPGISGCVGIDVDETAVNIGKNRYQLDLRAISLGQLDTKFDNIVLCHTLEHIEELSELAQKIDNLLNPNGKLFISVPNIEALSAKWFLQAWKGLSYKYHIWYFDRKTITRCFASIFPQHEIIHRSSYLIWPILNCPAPAWRLFKRVMPGLVRGLELRFLGDQLDLVMQRKDGVGMADNGFISAQSNSNEDGA